MAQRGLAEDDGEASSLHMALVGPPGTAKTSIARIMCKMYFGLGILQSPEFIEVIVNNLSANTSARPKRRPGPSSKQREAAHCSSTKPPPSTNPTSNATSAAIALDTIMKFAEDHRRDTMICLAGYAAPMSTLMSANPGLRSRFPHKLEFDLQHSCRNRRDRPPIRQKIPRHHQRTPPATTLPPSRTGCAPPAPATTTQPCLARSTTQMRCSSTSPPTAAMYATSFRKRPQDEGP